MRATKIGIAYLLLSRTTSAFIGIQQNQARVALNPSRSQSFLSFYEVEGKNSNEFFDVPDNEHPAAVEALERLLKRQKAELALTENLLKNIREPTYNADLDSGPLSFAASIASGFDYGFKSRSEGAPSEVAGALPGYSPPKNVWSLGWQQFFRNLDAMKGEYADEEDEGTFLMPLHVLSLSHLTNNFKTGYSRSKS
jgi:hypothetical protein